MPPRMRASQRSLLFLKFLYRSLTVAARKVAPAGGRGKLKHAPPRRRRFRLCARIISQILTVAALLRSRAR